ncbi:GDSL-type esterase/lipase family protein [Streptomyces sp. NPDC004647]|uniref:GDSL-type esterase/lipase family protein n=1 Tax=Streptomyces sp. NPDC004647 TaxID=3154671 RepID=UPI0033A4DB0B
MSSGWLDPEPFLRGVAWRYEGRMVRADPEDRLRLPQDTWQRARIPVGVRLEFTADGASALEVRYEAGEPGPAEVLRELNPIFELWRDDEPLAEVPARSCAEDCVPVPLPTGQGPFTLHLPESLSPRVLGIRAVGGVVSPAPPRPRWAVYGDSITEGWFSSRPALAWPAVAGRSLGLDHVNLGYAGSALGELASAEQLASLPCDLLTLAFGTNCWDRVPHTARLLHETTRLFLELVRQARPRTPLLVVSPVVRPGADDTPNRLGATLSDLRTALETAVEERTAAGDDRLALLPGAHLLRPGHLADGVHPDDKGQAALGAAVSAALCEAGFAARC